MGWGRRILANPRESDLPCRSLSGHDRTSPRPDRWQFWLTEETYRRFIHVAIKCKEVATFNNRTGG